MTVEVTISRKVEMEFEGDGGTEIRTSPGFLSKMTRGFRQKKESRVKWFNGFQWVKTVSCGQKQTVPGYFTEFLTTL